MNKPLHLLIINPGSTSTKISVFEDRTNLFTESLFHDAPTLLSFPNVNDQVPFRKDVILSFLKRHGYSLSDIDIFVGRGGSAYPQKSGVLEIDSKLYKDTKDGVGGSEHPSKLGVMIAWDFACETGKKAYTLDAINVDEFTPVARITGIKDVFRKAQSHVLNQKAVARIHAKSIGKSYEDCNFIVSHIDGGISVTAHSGGLMVDTTEGAGGEGPFSPTRIGTIPVLNVVEALENYSKEELKTMCSRSGGFVSHFGTSNAEKVHEMALSGNSHASLVWEAMCYQTSKAIGEMACVLQGNVDAIILTGGLVRYNDIVDYIKKTCSWIAPIATYPGEVEQETMAYQILDVIEGKSTSFRYTGNPVFKGFDWE